MRTCREPSEAGNNYRDRRAIVVGARLHVATAGYPHADGAGHTDHEWLAAAAEVVSAGPQELPTVLADRYLALKATGRL